MQLNYNLSSPQDRINQVNTLINTTPANKLSEQYLNYMGDYLLFTSDKNQTKKEQKENFPIITKNREVTISKRQISYEGLVASLENDEDRLYNLINNDKNQILDPKNPITPADIEKIPEIKNLLIILESLQKQFQKATGPAKYSLKKTIIETWQQIYILKASYQASISPSKTSANLKTFATLDLTEHIHLNEDLIPISDGKLSLLNANHISFLLCYYPQLKQEC